MDEMTVEERVAHCRTEIKSGEPLPNWRPTRWVNALTYRLGSAAYNANEFEEAINKVFPGTAVDSMEQLKHDFIVIAAVAMDAVTKLESDVDA